jgi:hypothetical protein
MSEPRPTIDEYADQLAARFRPTKEQLGRIAALLRTDPATTSRPEQDRGVDPLAS